MDSIKMFKLTSSFSNQSTQQSREASSHREEDAEWLPTPLSEDCDKELLSYLEKRGDGDSSGAGGHSSLSSSSSSGSSSVNSGNSESSDSSSGSSNWGLGEQKYATSPSPRADPEEQLEYGIQFPSLYANIPEFCSPLETGTTKVYTEGLPLSHTGPAEAGLWKSLFPRKILAQGLEANKQPQSPPVPDFGRSRKFVPGLPRPGTFKRQDSERRKRLTPSEVFSSERNFTAKSGAAFRRSMSAYIDEANDLTNSSLFINNDTTVGIDTPVRESLDEQIQHELETKWILNLSMQFRDGTPREKFHVTYAETPSKWRRATVSCDYRKAPSDSLEEELKALQKQGDKSAAIYGAIRDSLPDIRFYDTVTNLRLETREGRLHVHVSEDFNEIESRMFRRSLEKERTMLELKRFFDKPIQKAGAVKVKQGLVGFANGTNMAAMADTGSRENIISAAYAKDLGLKVEGSPSSFKIGNAQKIQSLGTVSLLWAFAENPKESFSILCHVLPRCTYSLILGNGFLRATETITKFRHRLTKCLFSVINNVSHFGFLGETYQRLEGTIADLHPVFAIPDTGANRNVMSLQYAMDNGLDIKTEPQNRGYLQFADGSFDETVGQVDTHWTFASGQRIPVTFEILRYCCSDVIIGEEILTEHEVFEKHAGSILSDMAFDDDSYELAPFDFVNSWQRGYERLVEKVTPGKDLSHPKGPTADAEAEEQHRRNVWNHKYDFGAGASTGEKELELARRERYRATRHLADSPSSSHPNRDSNDARRGMDPPVPQQRMPVISSIPTSQSRR